MKTSSRRVAISRIRHQGDTPADESLLSLDAHAPILTYEDQRLPDETVILIQMKGALAKAFKTLRPIEQKVLQGRFMEELTLKEIGDSEGIMPERVRELGRSALKKLREKLHPYSNDGV